MKTTLHDIFAIKVTLKIREKLENLKKNQVETRRFINKIDYVNDAIHFEEDDEKFKHVSDIRFHHENVCKIGCQGRY